VVGSWLKVQEAAAAAAKNFFGRSLKVISVVFPYPHTLSPISPVPKGLTGLIDLRQCLILNR